MLIIRYLDLHLSHYLLLPLMRMDLEHCLPQQVSFDHHPLQGMTLLNFHQSITWIQPDISHLITHTVLSFLQNEIPQTIRSPNNWSR
jgi:hypothetical protein